MSIKNNTTKLQEILETINALPEAGSGGGDINLPILENEGAASELFAGKELIDGEGNIVEGTFTIDNELSTQDDLIAQIQAAVDGLPDAGNGEPILQSKTVTPTKNSQTVTANSGYDGLSEVIVNGDNNLVANNIKSGVSIFGISGNYEGSASGGSGSGPTINVTISDSAGMTGAFYFNKNGEVQNVTGTTVNVNALAGIVFIKSVLETISATGNYIASSANTISAVRFLEDGGTATVSFA